MNIITFIIFGLLQICVAQFGAAVDVKAFGATKTSIGAASATALGGSKADGAAQVVAGPGFVKSTAVASASSKKHHKPPPKKHTPPPTKKHSWCPWCKH